MKWKVWLSVSYRLAFATTIVDISDINLWDGSWKKAPECVHRSMFDIATYHIDHICLTIASIGGASLGGFQVFPPPSTPPEPAPPDRGAPQQPPPPAPPPRWQLLHAATASSSLPTASSHTSLDEAACMSVFLVAIVFTTFAARITLGHSKAFEIQQSNSSKDHDRAISLLRSFTMRRVPHAPLVCETIQHALIRPSLRT